MEKVRCERCLGMGYKGRWRNRMHGRTWKIETCPKCRGTGQQEQPERKGTK